MKNNNSIKPVVAVGIGAALFFVLGRFVAIPSPVPNTNISLQYAVLALLAAMYGPVLACARPRCRLKAPPGLSLLRKRGPLQTHFHQKGRNRQMQ